MNGPPTVFGSVAVLVLVVACLVLPEELFGYRTPYLFAGVIIIACLLCGTGYVLWTVVRTAFGKNRT